MLGRCTVVLAASMWASACCLTRPAPEPEPIPPDQRCTSDEECSVCSFDRVFSSPEECECLDCGAYPVRRDACHLYYGSWEERCRHMEEGETCPLVDCDPPPPATCARGRCELDHGA